MSPEEPGTWVAEALAARRFLLDAVMERVVRRLCRV